MAQQFHVTSIDKDIDAFQQIVKIRFIRRNMTMSSEREDTIKYEKKFTRILLFTRIFQL